MFISSMITNKERAANKHFLLSRVIGGPILGVFCLGLFVPFANAKGAFAGTLTSLVFLVWIFLGFNIYGISYPKKQFCSCCGCDANSTTVTQTLVNRISGLEYSQRPYLLAQDTPNISYNCSFKPYDGP